MPRPFRYALQMRWHVKEVSLKNGPQKFVNVIVRLDLIDESPTMTRRIKLIDKYVEPLVAAGLVEFLQTAVKAQGTQLGLDGDYFTMPQPSRWDKVSPSGTSNG